MVDVAKLSALTNATRIKRIMSFDDFRWKRMVWLLPNSCMLETFLKINRHNNCVFGNTIQKPLISLDLDGVDF